MTRSSQTRNSNVSDYMSRHGRNRTSNPSRKSNGSPVQPTRNNSYRYNAIDFKIADKVHHHHHYKPKDHDKNFAWLDYLYDRQSKAETLASSRFSRNNNMGSWADLTSKSTIWGNFTFFCCQRKWWSWEDFWAYKWNDFAAKFSLDGPISKYIGLRANEVNIKLFGSQKAVYQQNYKMVQAMKRQNTILRN